MKKLFFSIALSSFSLLTVPAAFGGPGESAGNTKNECNTAVNECDVTPTKFSAKVYRVALCTSNPMTNPATTPDWDGSGCVDVYNNSNGEDTGDIFSATGATLSSEYISIPSTGEYSFIAALFDKDFKAGSHHMVYAAGGAPVNNKRYVSTSSGGAIEGTASSVALMTGSLNTFASQLDCNTAYAEPNAVDRTGLGGNPFYGRLLDANFTLTSSGSGNISANPSTAICDNVKYLMSIVPTSITVNTNTTGVHLKILAATGLVRADQGSSGNGVIDGFSANPQAITVDVEVTTN